MAKRVARWQWPARSAEAELKSLILQAERYYVTVPPDAALLEAKTREMLEMYPVAPLPYAFFAGSLQAVGFRVSFQSALAGVERDSTPGMPFASLGCVTNGQVIERYERWLELLVWERLKLLSRSESLPGDAVELVRQGYCDPVRIFVKNEPHNPTKISEGRLRLISSVSLVDQMCERVLYGRQNRVEIDHWETIPSKPGMGLDDESLKVLYEDWAKMDTPYEADISGWDFSMQDWEMQWEADFRARLSDAEGTAYHRALRNRNWCEARTLFMLTDGRFIAQRVPGKRCSGSYNTSAGNSRCRVLAGLLVGSKRVFAMGDDSVEDARGNPDDIVKAYERLGHRVKMFEKCADGFAFCSTRIRLVGGRVVGEPQNWDRMLFKLLHMPTGVESMVQERLAQFSYEMRGHPWLPRIEGYLAKIYFPMFATVLQSGRGGPQMPPKKTVKSKKAKKKKNKNKSKSKSSLPGPVVAMDYSAAQRRGDAKRMESTVVKHIEYLEDIRTDSKGEVSNFAYSINAALVESFPWLGAIGGNFQRYKFTQLLWRYTPACPTTTPGNIVAATVPDTHDPLLSGYVKFMGAQGSSQVNVYQPMVHNSLAVRECGRMGLCRSGPVSSNADSNLYDAGVFQIMVEGCPPNTLIGRLSVSYAVTLYTPVVGSDADSSVYYWENTAPSEEQSIGYWANRTVPEPLHKFGSMIVERAGNQALRFLKTGVFEVLINAWGRTTAQTPTSLNVSAEFSNSSVEPSYQLTTTYSSTAAGASDAVVKTVLVAVGTVGAVMLLPLGTSPGYSNWKIGAETVSSTYNTAGFILTSGVVSYLPRSQAVRVAQRLTSSSFEREAIVAKFLAATPPSSLSEVDSKESS